MKLSGLPQPLVAAALLVGSILGGSNALAQGAGDPAAGEKKAYTCLGCHGIQHYVNVYPSYHVPLIAGQNAAYLTAALQAYQSGERQHQTMQANADLLSDQDIADITSWLESVGGEAGTDQKGEAPDAATTCVACHGPTGLSAAPQWPALAGQYKSYIEQSLKSYQTGERNNAIMMGIAATLSDDDIRDLAEYYSAQQGPLVTAPINN